MTVSGIFPQRRLKAFLWLRAKNGIGLCGITKLNVKVIDFSYFISGIFDINGIAHFVGRGQRITDRLNILGLPGLYRRSG